MLPSVGLMRETLSVEKDPRGDVWARRRRTRTSSDLSFSWRGVREVGEAGPSSALLVVSLPLADPRLKGRVSALSTPELAGREGRRLRSLRVKGGVCDVQRHRRLTSPDRPHGSVARLSAQCRGSSSRPRGEFASRASARPDRPRRGAFHQSAEEAAQCRVGLGWLSQRIFGRQWVVLLVAERHATETKKRLVELARCRYR